MTATAPAPEGMDIEDGHITSNTRTFLHEKAVSAVDHINDFAGEPGQALSHPHSYSIDSESGIREQDISAQSENEVPPPTRRRARDVAGDNSRYRDISGSEEGYDHRLRDAGSSRTGSFESTDSGSDRRTRRRRDFSGGSPNSPRRYDRNRDSRRRHDSSGSNGSVSPRWDRGVGGGGRGGETFSRRGGGGEGSPRELEPSKVLHVRNVGYPVVQVRRTKLAISGLRGARECKQCFLFFLIAPSDLSAFIF